MANMAVSDSGGKGGFSQGFLRIWLDGCAINGLFKDYSQIIGSECAIRQDLYILRLK